MSKVYITKYALTQGIFEKEIQDIKGGMVIVHSPCSINDVLYFHGKDWHLSRDEAVKRAEQMRASKIKSLKKAITDLEALTF